MNTWNPVTTKLIQDHTVKKNLHIFKSAIFIRRQKSNPQKDEHFSHKSYL